MLRWTVLGGAFTSIAVCACGSSGGSTPAPRGATPSASPAVSPAQPPATASPLSTTSPAPGCAGLEVALNNEQGAAGTIYAEFEVRNDSATDCMMSGFPSVAMIIPANPSATSSEQQDTSVASGAVDLPPGTDAMGVSGVAGHGWFVVAWNDNQCLPSASNMPSQWGIGFSGYATMIEVSAKDPVSHTLPTVCGGALTVKPLHAQPY